MLRRLLLVCLLSLWAAVPAQHSVTLQRFDFERDQTLKKEVGVYLDRNADDLAAAACYELYFDAGAREVNQCVVMATHTIRDHLLAMAHATAAKLVPTGPVDGPHNDVTSIAVQYAYGSDASDKQTLHQRVCYVGFPPTVDFLFIIHTENVGEFVLYLASTELYRLSPSMERLLRQTASSVGKEVSVVTVDYKELFHAKESFQLCDTIHFQRTLSEEVSAVLSSVLSSRGNQGTAPLRATRVVLVRDIDMGDRLKIYPLVSVQARLFAAYNTTVHSLLGPAGSAALVTSGTNGTVQWQLFSVWVDRARMHAISNYDGITGRAFVTSRAAGGVGVTQMQEVCVGELRSLPMVAPSLQVTDLAGEKIEDKMNQVIAITYTIRVFGETAEGLKAALRRIGYTNVFVLPDMTLGALAFLRSAGSGGRSAEGDAEVLQIALGPHDFTMLLPRYVVFQMEQVWSAIAFAGEYRLRYGLVLSGARAVLSYSPLHADLLRRLGYARVFEVPLYSADIRRAQEVTPMLFGNAGPGVDFMFFGGCSERRKEKLEAIVAAFPVCAEEDNSVPTTPLRSCYRYLLNCVGWETGVFDAMRHRSVQQSGVVLNIHNDDSSVLEVHRVNYLLSMGRCVVSERSDDFLLDAQYERSVRFVGAGDDAGMHAAVKALLHNATDLRICQENALVHYRALMVETAQLAAAMTTAFDTSLV